MDSEPTAPHQIASTAASVLIVDQDFMSRWRAADYLRERGYNIIEATGVPDALSLLASGMHVHIVFFDLHPPNAPDCRLLAEWLEKHHPRLPLLMTSDASPGAIKLAPSLTHHVITEPYELALLAANIESILKGY